MAMKANILTEDEILVREVVREYGYPNLTPKAKLTLVYLIVETEKTIKENENG